jgi:SSS family solute:Na+ symporter
MNIDIVIIILFLLSNLLIGYVASRKIISFEHFSVGHRSFSSLIIFCTLSATFLGAGYTVGNANQVYESGLVYSFALLGFSVKEILVASFIAPRMGQFNDCHSIGDMIEKTYGKEAKIFTGIISLIVCGGILGAQVGAISSIIRSTLPIDPTIGAIVSLSFLLIYASLGGMRAVVFTDTFQFFILAIGIPLTLFIGLHHVGGWETVTKTVPRHYLYFLYDLKSTLFFILMFVTFIFGETLVPPYVQRLFMAKSTTETFRGTLASGLFSMPFFIICGCIGLVAYTYNQHVNASEAFSMVVNNLLPVGIRGFVIAALLSIILSSAAGFLNAASISFVNDIVKPLTKHPEKTNYLLMARISTFFVGVISIIFALSVTGILNMLLAAYNFWSPIILVPLVAAIFGFKSKRIHFFVPALFGIIGSLTWTYLFHTPLGVSPILFGLILNLFAFISLRKLS